MPALLAAIEAAVAYILQVLGITQLMYGLLQQFGVIISTAAQEHYKFEIQGYTLAANNQLADPTVGLAAIKTELDGIGLAIIALGNPQQTAQPVTLPTVAPSGYGGATASAAASAVWNYSQGGGSQTAQNLLIGANNVYGYLGETFALQLSCDSHFYLRAAWAVDLDIGGTDVQSFTTGGILPTDASILDWLNRAFPAFAWFLDTESAYGARVNLPGENDTWVYCLMSPAEFYWLRANMAALATPTVAPVWPGIANVTLGAPVTMTPPGDNVAVPCDGVIIAVTGTPSWAGSFSFGTAISYRNVGAVTFTDDNGEQEFAQTFSWTSGVYCPKSMRTAAGFAYRAAIGVSGTVTPFTIN